MNITGTLIEIGKYDEERMQRYIVVKETGLLRPQSAVLRLDWPTAMDFNAKLGDTITVNFHLHTFTLRNGHFANSLDVWAYNIHEEKQITDVTPDEETINKVNKQ